MNAYIASHKQLESWFRKLSAQAALFFPVKTEGINYRFETIDNHSLLDFFNYRPSILPPVKKLFPDGEVLFTFEKDQQGHYRFNPTTDVAPQILSGVRACDLKAIHLLDKVFSEGVKDRHYLQRREKTNIIAFNCLTPCDDHCFCEAAQSLDFQTGADIYVTRIDESVAEKGSEKWLLEVLSKDGEKLIDTLNANKCPAHHELKQQALAKRPKPFGRQYAAPLDQIAKTIHEQDANLVYEHYAQRCFSCGTCNLVCPTCYCFETSDELSLDGHSGQKIRHWDACLNPSFAEVAGGHNFRSEPAARQRHRVRRKFDYLQKRFADSFCTGCGRCGRQCTTGIDIFNIVNDVFETVSGTISKTTQELEP